MHHASEERKHVKIFALITAECRFQGLTDTYGATLVDTSILRFTRVTKAKTS
jgi:hypothetical protein